MGPDEDLSGPIGRRRTGMRVCCQWGPLEFVVRVGSSNKGNHVAVQADSSTTSSRICHHS